MQFDGWTVDRVSGEISRKGKASRLPQQPLRILIELFDHAGSVVTREQLVKVLWPAGVVDFDNGLNVAVRKLRVALDDVGDVPRYIETLPRVGYRFIGRQADAPPAARPGLKPLARVAIGLGVIGVAAAMGVAWWLGGDDVAPEAPPAVAAKPRHVPSVRARELYLEGLHQRSRRDINANPAALQLFEEAVKEDPHYAEAWAALGESYSGGMARQLIPPSQENIEKARQSALRSIELNPGITEGHTLLAQLAMDYDKDFAAAKKEYDIALALNDKSARLWHFYGMWLGQTGKVDEALEALRRSRELEPMTPLYSGNYAMLLYQGRRYEEAIAYLEPLVRANPNFDQARSLLARSLMATGNLPGALDHLQKRGIVGGFQGDLGSVYARMGRRDDALREIGRLEAMGREGYGVAYEQALIYVGLGDLDRGCEYLMRATMDRSLLVNWMRLEPRLDPLRGRQCYADAEQKLFGSLN